MAAGQREIAVNILGASPMFTGVDQGILRTMVDALIMERWPERSVVMAPHKTVTRFYVLLGGRVKITRQNMKNGREVTLFLLGPGDGFNIVSLMDDQPQDVCAQTLDAVEVLSGSIEQWKAWLEAYPVFRLAVRKYVYQRLRDLCELASDLALHDTMTRLAHLLLRYCSDRLTCPDINLIGDLSHEELAHMIGTVRVVVNRLLAELKREGIIDTQGGKLHVMNMEKLLQKTEQQLYTARNGATGPLGASPR
jgi:CRP/FNR family cyclic AMP-dependent transcriptional regulator